MNHTEACETAGITTRQLDFWTRRGYIHSRNDGPGSGHARDWDEGEVRVARRIARLLLAGFTLATSHKIARLLDSNGGLPLADGGVSLALTDGIAVTMWEHPEDVEAGQV